MTAMLSSLMFSSGDANAATPAVEYLVNHGKSGGFGRFAGALALRRGERVVIQSQRGLEIGTVLCPATSGHIQLLAATSTGRIVRRAETADDEAVHRLQILGRQVLLSGADVDKLLAVRQRYFGSATPAIDRTSICPVTDGGGEGAATIQPLGSRASGNDGESAGAAGALETIAVSREDLVAMVREAVAKAIQG